ncbi:unnamed protein product [marine sediment metagenome]|uniref:THIF-type NAD/FAD binding fold domain-containing protein n=1 Tax=marine sediment metagenome TaxID=412755 RepID=X1SZT4_9ZZZZ
MLDADHKILLIDHDRVEPHNLRRQNFFAGDVGKFKSQVLAERLSRQYGKPIAYSVFPFQHDLVGEELGSYMSTRAIQGLIIGCVDNAAAREEISRSLRPGNWWLDSGNGYSSGQVLIGNATSRDALYAGFDKASKQVSRLPAPSWQLPSLLVPEQRAAGAPMDCAEAVAADRQSPIINQAMAMLVLEFIRRLLEGTLTWMGAYIDMEAGILQTVPAEPQMVARICGVRLNNLFESQCSIGRRYSLRVP